MKPPATTATAMELVVVLQLAPWAPAVRVTTNCTRPLDIFTFIHTYAAVATNTMILRKGGTKNLYYCYLYYTKIYYLLILPITYEYSRGQKTPYFWEFFFRPTFDIDISKTNLSDLLRNLVE